VIVVTNLCGPMVIGLKTRKSAGSLSFEELLRNSHHRARCGPLYHRVLVFCITSALFSNIEHFIIYVLLCNSRTRVITLLFGLCM
jgi:hypothetical protein